MSVDDIWIHDRDALSLARIDLSDGVWDAIENGGELVVIQGLPAFEAYDEGYDPTVLPYMEDQGGDVVYYPSLFTAEPIDRPISPSGYRLIEAADERYDAQWRFWPSFLGSMDAHVSDGMSMGWQPMFIPEEIAVVRGWNALVIDVDITRHDAGALLSAGMRMINDSHYDDMAELVLAESDRMNCGWNGPNGEPEAEELDQYTILVEHAAALGIITMVPAPATSAEEHALEQAFGNLYQQPITRWDWSRDAVFEFQPLKSYCRENPRAIAEWDRLLYRARLFSARASRMIRSSEVSRYRHEERQFDPWL